MSSPWLRFALVGPVFAFVLVGLAAALGSVSPASYVIAGLVAVPALSVLRPRALGWLLAPSVVVFAFVGLVSWLSPHVPTGAAADLVVGTLLGLPLWFLGVAVGGEDRPGVGLLALQAGLLEGVTIESALATLPAGAGSDRFLLAWFTTVGHQLGAVGAALSGGGLTGTQPIPLGSYADPVFIGLALLALSGILLPLIGADPHDGVGRAVPSRRDLAESVRRLPPPVLYATAAPATRRRAPLGAGIGPAVGTALGVLVFLGVASAAPAYTFLVVTLGVVGAVVLLGRLGAMRPNRPAYTRPVAPAGPR